MTRTPWQILGHLLMPGWRVRRVFPRAVLARIEAAVAASEVRHGGQIRFVVEGALGVLPLFRGHSARDRARQVFAGLGVWDTRDNNGVLIYLLLADRDVEILADRGFNGKVDGVQWEAVCQEMEGHFRAGRFEAGALAGIARVDTLLARHFPRGPGGQGSAGNELPDAPALL
ncbi:MAG: TPM domain-containing protein [Pseudomonadota bacterium]